MSDKTKVSTAQARGMSAAAAASGAQAEPDVVDFLPLPVYPLLGVQVHCVRWQKIVQGMKRKGVVVRVHRESDRGGLFKAASRVGVKLTSRRCAGAGDEGPSWLVRIRSSGARGAGDIDAADPTASDRGRYRALGLVVLQRGSISLKGRDMAVALHRSLREFIRDNGLAGTRQRNAVVVEEGADGQFTVSVEAGVRAAFAERDKKRSPAA